jgi:signal recognition particle GTPase
VLANVLSDNLTMLRVGVREDVLDEVVAVLIARDINQRNARTIVTTLTNSIKVASKEINTTNLEALLNNLGSKLIHAVLGSIADDMVNGSATISWSTMFADVLNAPIAELAVSNNVNTSKNFFNARTLGLY